MHGAPQRGLAWPHPAKEGDEQPELMRRIITAFLLDQPDVIPAYTSDLDPRAVKKIES